MSGTLFWYPPRSSSVSSARSYAVGRGELSSRVRGRPFADRHLLRGLPPIGIALTILPILDRFAVSQERSDLESVVARESSFLFITLVSVVSLCSRVLWGTCSPLSRKHYQRKDPPDKPWFYRLMIPIELFLLFLTGVGPLLRGSERRSTPAAYFTIPESWGSRCSGVLFAAGIHHVYSLISFGRAPWSR